MRRRTILASLTAGVAALAGCSGSTEETPTLTPVPVGNGTEGPSPTPTDPPAGDDHGDGLDLGRASVVVLETGPRTLALAPPEYRRPNGARVRVEFAATATADHPARLRAVLSNASEGTTTFRLDAIPPFRPVTDSRLRTDACPDCESTLYLAPTTAHDLVAEDADGPSYERGPEGYWRASASPPELPSTVELGPDERVGGEYLLLGEVDRRGFPTGTYDFTGGDTDAFRITAWHTGRPGPQSDSRFEGADVPSLPDTDEVAWYHEAGPSTEVFIRPSTERVDLAGAVDLELVNHSREPLTGNPYYWKLWKLDDGDWYHVAPWGWPVPIGAVAPGGEQPYGLRAFSGEAGESRDDHAHPVGYLGGGTYAFEVGMARKSTGWTHAALLALRGPPVNLAPTGDLTVVRDGSRVVVSAPEFGDGEHPPDARLTLRPVEDGGAGTGVGRVLVEQVMRQRNRGLRNTLAFVDEGVEAVVLRADTHAVPRYVRNEADSEADGNDGGTDGATTHRFRFRGRDYELSIEREEA